jgi:DNA-binding PadR family transcriptional regulator
MPTVFDQALRWAKQNFKRLDGRPYEVDELQASLRKVLPEFPGIDRKKWLFIYSPGSLSPFFEVGEEIPRLMISLAKLGTVASEGGMLLGADFSENWGTPQSVGKFIPIAVCKPKVGNSGKHRTFEKWSPKPGRVYPALLDCKKDSMVSCRIFPSVQERDEEIARIMDEQVRAAFPALPAFSCPLPVRVKIVGSTTVAIQLPGQNEWHETQIAQQAPKRRGKKRRRRHKQHGVITLPIKTDDHTEKTLAQLFSELADRVETLPDGTKQITFGPGEFKIEQEALE